MDDLIHQSDWLTITNKADKTVEIDITGVIGGSFWDDDDPNSTNTKEKMRAELKAIAELKADKIIINIDSPGGSVPHGFSMHDLLAQHPAKKETRIIGMAASIATVIAQVGDIRKISDNALFLAHRAMTIGIGNKNDIQVAMDKLKIIDSKIINIYTKRGVDETKAIELMDANNGNGKWIDGVEAKDLGFIDEVFEPTKAAAVFDKQIFNKLKYPEIPSKMTNDEAKTLGEKVDTLVEKVTAFFTKPPDPVTDPIEPPAKTDLEISNEKVTSLESQIVELKAANEAEKTALEAQKSILTVKETEANNLLKELQDLKNEWKPEKRISGTGSVEGALDKDTIRENLKTLKNKK